ncbi:molybdenum cofactor sulfurase isoform X2 [Mercurialis annua]|uniref:molybdenum cofactor sulfurase isoform X2 n=1 Tax=Mercurialis annua TaxID=3986 RepID=UPI00215DF42A|nr:molybdenum cofactor sulfurase isoform X2 [Mercurialis annua]
MDASKEQFLKEFGHDYGYPNGPKSIDEIRATEFKRLEQNGTVYLDHAGATLYSELQMEAVFKDLSSNVYGNPHSQSEASSATFDIVRQARQEVLDYFNASPKDYKCIFTSGATGALKLIGEAFPWNQGSSFMYTMENHNSVLGIREYALSKGAKAFAVDIESVAHHEGVSKTLEPLTKMSMHQVQRRNKAEIMEGEAKADAFNLFAFPLECNFSGFRFGLNLVNDIKKNPERILEGSQFCKGNWMVLIDAAKGCATQPLDLSSYSADFVVLSFYKLFGYPTGLGALIVRNDAAKILKKAYFSGGTVAASIADVDFVRRRDNIEELFEDGTISFLSIASIRHGFKILKSLTASAICRHTTSLTAFVEKVLMDLKHGNGANVCTIYKKQVSKAICQGSGSLLSFNLLRPDGSWFGSREVEKLASLSGIQLRTGCFCNPGACAKYLGLSHSDLLSNLEAGHVCWDDNDILHGKPTGAVRVSFAYMSTYEDAKAFVDFVKRSFVSTLNKSGNGHLLRTRSALFSGEEKTQPLTGYHLKTISIYPIKSCGGFTVERWPLSSTGLRHDREWLLKSLTGEILTQKKVPEMCFISTSIDLNQGIMFVESPRCRQKLKINLSTDSDPAAKEEIELHAKSNAVGRPCTLLRYSSSENKVCSKMNRGMNMCRDVESRFSFANEAQFLLLSEESVSDLNSRLNLNVQKGSNRTFIQINPMRFRPNLVISGGEPYAEDGWRSLKIGSEYFTSLGGCNRCQMINLVNQSGQVQRSNEPLATLAAYRRVKGKILFGILLKYDNSHELGLSTDSWLQVGEEVYTHSQ